MGYIFGYITPRTIFLWSVLLITNNLATTFDLEPYVELKRRYPVWIAFYLALPALAIAFLDRLQRRDFERYRKRAHAAADPAMARELSER